MGVSDLSKLQTFLTSTIGPGLEFRSVNSRSCMYISMGTNVIICTKQKHIKTPVFPTIYYEVLGGFKFSKFI